MILLKLKLRFYCCDQDLTNSSNRESDIEKRFAVVYLTYVELTTNPDDLIKLLK